MENKLKENLSQIANTLRQLSIEGIQKANSGHPGLPLGCAEIGAYLYGYALHHNPKNPHWPNRDLFILSAGHGSMLLYSCLHLSGFDLSLDEIKKFRQLHSHTPGHPEYGMTPGVEATTGPLGQGVGNAVGMALAYKILQSKFNKENFSLFTNKIFCLAGDGCMMEGVSSEASSLAGHLGLDNLVVIYDSNNISLDGPLSESMSEDTKARYLAYGWDIYEIDGHSFEEIDGVISKIRNQQKKPCLIIAHTIIGKGSPHKAGSHKVHGAPLGEEELKETKKALGLPDEVFFVSQEVKDFFSQHLKNQQEEEGKWNTLYDNWAKKYPELAKEFVQMKNKTFPSSLEKALVSIEVKNPVSGREASNYVINTLAKQLPFLYGGSADLSSSDKTYMKDYPAIASHHFEGRNIKYGAREFAMGTISNGLFLSGFMIPFCGTFLTFSDYMRNSIRLAALSSYQVIYQFTHDSIYLGEDGPTHQPIEHFAALRAMPNLVLIRPGSSWEVKMAWLASLKHTGPTALILSRQSIDEIESTHVPYEEGLSQGAYIILMEKKKAEIVLVATGSELFLAMKVAKQLIEKNKDVRVVSFPSWELFEKQSKEYKHSIFPDHIYTVSIEAGVDQGWHKYIGKNGLAISIDQFGLSAPAKDVAKEYGFDVDKIVSTILS